MEKEKEKDIQSQINHIDYKDTELLKKFLTPHGKIMPRKRSGVSVKNQRRIARAVKRARFMGLLPFTFK
jgi:small subunit ribosomal protein S18